MVDVLIPLLIVLTALVAGAVYSGLPNVSMLTALLDRGLARWSKLRQLAHCVQEKDLVGEFKQADSFADFTSRISRGAEPDPEGSDLYTPLDMSVLNCRIWMTELKETDSVVDAFGVDICGSIHAPDDMRRATLKISILDITDGIDQAKTVQARTPQDVVTGESNGVAFCHAAELGRLPQETTTLENWTSVARLRTDGQVFARRGTRTLQFDALIVSTDGSQELASARCTFVYDNPLPGYIDLQENAERTKVLTVALAFAVSAANGKLLDCEVELIKNWARENVVDDSKSTSDQSRHDLEKALSTTVSFFREGKKLDTYGLCEEFVEIAPMLQRYEVLDLCLRVAHASGSVAPEEVAILKKLAGRLGVDPEKFRNMVQKILPVDMYEVMDLNDLLGISADMNSESTRKQLNKEYSKWNSRVTSANPEIQSQADQMLKLIAEARGQWVDEKSACLVGAPGE